MWLRILALIHKEFLALLKDPKSRTVLIENLMHTSRKWT